MIEKARYKVSLLEENADFTFKKIKNETWRGDSQRTGARGVRPPVQLLVLDKDEAKSSLMPPFVE